MRYLTEPYKACQIFWDRVLAALQKFSNDLFSRQPDHTECRPTVAERLEQIRTH